MGSERPEPFELRVTEIDDPLPDATFGSIGRYVQVAAPDAVEEPFAPRRLTLGFDEKQAGHVDLWTVKLFEVDLDSREFTPVANSRINVDEREVTAWIDHPGTYGLIGLPKDPAVLETIRLLDRYTPQLLEERERGEHGLQDRICGLILCADPTPFGGGDGPGDLCAKCLGLDPTGGRLPDKYLLERQPPIRELHRHPDPGPELTPVGTSDILAWGENGFGTLGDGTKVERHSPVFVPGGSARKIVAAEELTLALSPNGTVWSWGANPNGELGDGTTTSREWSDRVSGLTNIVDITAGSGRGLAVRSDGSVWQWGVRDTFSSASDPTPVQTAGLSNAVAVAAGYSFNLVLTRDPQTGATRVWSWGENSFGQLGDGSRNFRAAPALVPNLTAIRAIAAGGYSAFAIKANGDVVAWGLGVGGQPGNLTPTPIAGLSNIEQVSVVNHAAARDTAGDVWVWGASNSGESGDGTQNSHLAPVKLATLSQVTGLATGWSHHVAFRADGTVWAWGGNTSGQIGDGGTSNALSPVQVPLPAGRNAVGVGGGPNWSFALLG